VQKEKPYRIVSKKNSKHATINAILLHRNILWEFSWPVHYILTLQQSGKEFKIKSKIKKKNGDESSWLFVSINFWSAASDLHPLVACSYTRPRDTVPDGQGMHGHYPAT